MPLLFGHRPVRLEDLVAGTGNKCPSACCLAKITNTYFVACDGDPTMSRVAPWLETSPGMPCQRWAALTSLDWRELKGEQTNAVALGKQHYSTRGWCSMSQRTSQKTAIMKNSRKQLLKLLKQLVNLLKQQFHGKNTQMSHQWCFSSPHLGHESTIRDACHVDSCHVWGDGKQIVLMFVLVQGVQGTSHQPMSTHPFFLVHHKLGGR